MAVKRASRGADAPQAKDVVNKSALKEEDTNKEKPLPMMVRVVLVCATSYMANYAWQNRAVLTDHLYNDNQTAAEQTMISVFAYFALMGAVFLGGLVMSKATVLTSSLF